jgi:hypothetical protein
MVNEHWASSAEPAERRNSCQARRAMENMIVVVEASRA